MMYYCYVRTLFSGSQIPQGEGLGPVRREQTNETLFRNYGRLMGRMHALAKTYQVSDPAWRRYDWDAPENNTAERQMPARETLALEKYRMVYTHLRSLPRDADCSALP